MKRRKPERIGKPAFQRGAYLPPQVAHIARGGDDDGRVTSVRGYPHPGSEHLLYTIEFGDSEIVQVLLDKTGRMLNKPSPINKLRLERCKEARQTWRDKPKGRPTGISEGAMSDYERWVTAWEVAKAKGTPLQDFLKAWNISRQTLRTAQKAVRNRQHPTK